MHETVILREPMTEDSECTLQPVTDP